MEDTKNPVPVRESTGEASPAEREAVQTDAQPPAPLAESPVTYSQEQVNAIAAKEAKKATERLLRDLGFEGEGKAKEQTKAFKSWWDAQKTEAERAQETLQKSQEENLRLAREMENIQAQNSCLKLGVAAQSTEDVIVLARAAKTEEMGMEEAIASVLTKYPQFKAQESAMPAVNPAGAAVNSSQKDNPWSKEGFNLTKQGQLLRENPKLAQKLMQAAGR